MIPQISFIGDLDLDLARSVSRKGSRFIDYYPVTVTLTLKTTISPTAMWGSFL